MAQFQLLRCSVALGGDTDNVVVRGRMSPILFPELPMIQFLHGEEAVTDVHVVGTCEMSQEEALARLRTIYTSEEVVKVFPGARPRLPTMDRSLPACMLPIHKPKPTTADSPDPILRPLDQFTMPHGPDDEDADDMPGFDNPKRFDEEDEDPGVDELLLGGDDHGLSPDKRPKVENLPQTRTSFRGQARQARTPQSHLPDIEGHRNKLPTDTNDHDRPKG